MKKLFLVAVIAAFGFNANAQEFKAGINAGLVMLEILTLLVLF